MADRWLFAGGGRETFRTLAGTIATQTSSTYFDTAYVDHAVECDSSNRGAVDFVDSSGASDYATTGEKLFAHLTVHQLSASATVANLFELFNDSDQPWLAVRCTGTSGVFGLYYNSNTGASPTWTQVSGSGTTNVSSGRFYIDVWITLGSPHIAGWAVNSSLIGEGNFTQASLTRLDAIHCRAQGATPGRYSEIMATVGISTVSGRVFYGKPTGAGANSGFTGAYTDIDDAGINDTDALSSGTAAQRSTFAYSNVPTLGANEALGDVFLYTRARNSGGAPSNVKPVRRDSGGTDNVGSSLSGIAGAYATLLTRYSALSETEFNASEFGVESAT